MDPFFAVEAESALASSQTDSEHGLSNEEVEKRRAHFGFNEIEFQKDRSYWLILFDQLKSPIVLLLLGGTLVSFLFRDYTEAAAIFIVIIINTAIGFFMEKQAMRSMAALRKLDESFCRVLRDGTQKTIPSKELVPGDVLLVEAGDIISADSRLLLAVQLEINESMLTGESLPVAKNIEKLPLDTMLAERTNMIFKGTSVTKGNGMALVDSIGKNTELGTLSQMVRKAKKQEIPINQKLDKLSKRLIWLILMIAVPFVVVGFFRAYDLHIMFETAIALAVAAIPEGLPIVATIALARGMVIMAKNNVIVKQLAAVETLGETNIIFTDKTGTLTQNKLNADIVFTSEGYGEVLWDENIQTASIPGFNNRTDQHPPTKLLLKIGALCNNAFYSDQSSDEHLGDPLDIALLKLAKYSQSEFYEKLKDDCERLHELPFDSDSRLMATQHRCESKYFISVKGALEEVLNAATHYLENDQIKPLSDSQREIWRSNTGELSRKGLKVLAFAFKQDDIKRENLVSDLVFVGLVGFSDPPRPEVSESLKECDKAGIKVIMVTGDHPLTAKAIAYKIGLTEQFESPVMHGKSLMEIDLTTSKENQEIIDTIIFSRVSPRQKLELVQYYQQRDIVVAMTGDGVNDAPALKKADIGIAMGKNGTQVAEEAADMVLQDDSFSSIIKAVKQGRIIFDNIRNFVIYLLSCNLSEIVLVSAAAFSNLALPLLPLQILFLNIVTDVFPALALGMGGGSPSVMTDRPRQQKEGILTKRHWISIVIYALIITFSVLGVFLYAMFVREFHEAICNNIAFYSLAFAQLWHPFNLVKPKDRFFKSDIFKNPYLWGAIAFCCAILIGTYFFVPLHEVLNIQRLNPDAWKLIVLGSLIPLVVIQSLKLFRIWTL